jgi:hypothetical protein
MEREPAILDVSRLMYAGDAMTKARRGEGPRMTHKVRHGFATVALRRLRGRGLKVMAQEMIGFGVAFAVSLAVSVAVVELIWGLI